jgi:hypothetical protein
MRITFYFALLLMSSALYAQSSKNVDAKRAEFLNMITENELSSHMHFIASDAMQGRKVGSPYELLAAEYLASQYRGMEIWSLNPPGGKSNPYLQSFDFTVRQTKGKSQNVIAWLEGSDPKLKEEFIIISAHYDHLGTGKKEGNDSIFNGAADDASGTVALLEIAESLKAAQNAGVKFKRSIAFMHMGGEESGMLGSNYYVATQPLIPLEKTAAIINMDGVAGTDKPQAPNALNYVYILVNDSTSGPLDKLAEKLNSESKINLEFPKPDHPERFVSDNKPFEYELIPSIYFSTGLTEHYHKVSDEPQTIKYSHLAKITRLVYLLAADLANANEIKNVRSTYAKTGTFYCAPCGCASDKKVFENSGTCPDCGMALEPKWTKK